MCFFVVGCWGNKTDFGCTVVLCTVPVVRRHHGRTMMGFAAPIGIFCYCFRPVYWTAVYTFGSMWEHRPRSHRRKVTAEGSPPPSFFTFTLLCTFQFYLEQGPAVPSPMCTREQTLSSTRYGTRKRHIRLDSTGYDLSISCIKHEIYN